MTDREILTLSEVDRLGRVATVDTARVFVTVDNHALLTRIPVGSLIGIEGSTPDEYFIAIAERVTRGLQLFPDVSAEDRQGNIPLVEQPVDALRAAIVATFRRVFGSKRNVFKRGSHSYPQIDKQVYLIEGQNLERLMGLLGLELEAKQRLQVGKYVADRPASVILDGNRFFQRHAAILGSTGSGKSWAVALLLEKAASLSFPNLLVLDMHGEYRSLAEGLAGRPGFAEYFRIAGPGDLKGTTPRSVVFLPFWLLNREEMLAMLLDRSDMNAPNQAARFTEHIRSLKETTIKSEGDKQVLETFTVDSPIPYQLGELLSLLQSDDTERVPGSRGDVNGPWHGKLTRFIARLAAKIDDRRYGFMFQPPSNTFKYDWLAEFAATFLAAEGSKPGIKIIDFSDVPSDVLPIVTSVFARLLYDVQFWQATEKRTPFSFVCDEAHLYLPTRENADAVEERAVATFERIAKEGRKYGVSLVVVSQRPSDVSRTILSQCNNFLTLRLTNDQDQNVVRRLVPDTLVGLVDVLPMLDIGEAVLLGDSALLPTRFRLDEPSIPPLSATLDFWTDWGTKQSKRSLVVDAVAGLRKQTRTKEKS